MILLPREENVSRSLHARQAFRVARLGGSMHNVELNCLWI